LFSLDKNELLKLDRLGEKSVENLLKAIEESKKNPFEKVLYGLGIRYVGETIAKKIAQHFKSIDRLASASKEELMNAEEIGEKIAQSIILYFNNLDNLKLIMRLKEVGLKFEINENEKSYANKNLSGKSFVISGVFSNFDRDTLKEIIENNGGKNLSAISSKTSYLIAGENPGQSKIAKAKELNIPIINEKEFMEML
jgi:DNA ligase (NAD+)